MIPLTKITKIYNNNSKLFSTSLKFAQKNSSTSSLRPQLGTEITAEKWADWLNSLATNKLTFKGSDSDFPMFRIMQPDGTVSKKNEHFLQEEPLKDLNKFKEMLRKMIKLNTMDTFLNTAQRQGRISFYMASFGEEGTMMGFSSALQHNDWIYPQYREHGILLERGMEYEEFIAQCYGAYNCQIKSRQMPVHYSNKDLYYMNVSSPLSTQIPHAAGAGYALKLDKADNIAVGFNGEGSCSQGDFYSGILFASRTKAHTLFAVRNNGYAISTPVTDQYDGDGVAPRAMAFDIPCLRVDGNDTLAVHYATKKCRELILKKSTPVLLEIMSYRVSSHSTSDSPTYRKSQCVEWWEDNYSPISRLNTFLEDRNVLKTHEVEAWQSEYLEEIKKTLNEVTKRKKPALSTLFEDLHYEKDANSLEQEAELKAHLNKYGQHYDLEKYHGGL